MANLGGYKKVGSGFSNEEQTIKVRYDFAVDGGATGAFNIFTAESDCIITDFHALVKTTATSGGSATVAVGVTGSTSAFVTTTQGAVANLTANAVFQANVVLTEGTPNTAAFPLPRRLASGESVLMTIGTAALTAGVVDYVMNVKKA